MYFNLQPLQSKARKTAIIWKLNLTGRWTYNWEGLYPEGLITGIVFSVCGLMGL